MGGVYVAGVTMRVVTVFAAGAVVAVGLTKAAGAAEPVSAVHPAAAMAAAASAVAPIVASFLPCVRAMSVTSFIEESSCLEDVSASPDVAFGITKPAVCFGARRRRRLMAFNWHLATGARHGRT